MAASYDERMAKVDWALLHAQKQILQRMVGDSTALHAQVLKGLVIFLDDLQDIAIERGDWRPRILHRDEERGVADVP